MAIQKQPPGLCDRGAYDTTGLELSLAFELTMTDLEIVHLSTRDRRILSLRHKSSHNNAAAATSLVKCVQASAATIECYRQEAYIPGYRLR